MKTLLWPLRLVIVLTFGLVVYALYFFDAAREARRKRQLGAAYEGPAED
jgi:hypothetical protein